MRIIFSVRLFYGLKQRNFEYLVFKLFKYFISVKLIAIIFAIVLIFDCRAQNISNLRKRFFVRISDTVRLDSLPVVPESVRIFKHGKRLNIDFSLVWYKSLLVLHQPVDSIWVQYRVFDFKLVTDSTQENRLITKYHEIEQEPLPYINDFSEDDLKSQGQITRSVSVGNSAQPGITSSMNLTLSGRLSDDVRIEAVIADNGLQSQDFAATYGLQDLNRAVINVYFPHSHLRAGDFVFKGGFGPFVRYRRNLKGLSYTGQDSAQQIRFGVGIQKGRYMRMVFRGSEANQGPYRLKGAENQEFIVVVSGSERVYVDGQLKQRGSDKDYVIDYSRAELTFTPHCPITRDSRIVVEYEYWITDFLRTTLMGFYRRSFDHSSFYAGYLRVSDNLAAAVSRFSQEQLRFLSGIGDSLDNALWLSADSVGQGGDYCLRDTVWHGQEYRIFEYARGKACAVWRVNFSYVGQGQGSYRLSTVFADGRIFEWVGPGQGSYSPYVKLQVPERKQVLGLGGWFDIGKWRFKVDLAGSRHDLNLLADAAAHGREAVNFGVEGLRRFSFKKFGFDSALFVLNYNFLSQNFVQFDRFLPVEFERDWNLGGLSGNMNLSKFGLNFYGQKKFFDFAASYLKIPGNYDGSKTDLSFNQNTKKWQANIWASGNWSKTNSGIARFLRSRQQIIRKFNKFSLGWLFDGESDIFLSDSLLSQSFSYKDIGAVVAFGDSARSLVKLQYHVRTDLRPFNNKMTKQFLAQNLSLNIHKTQKTYSQSLTLTYRRLRGDTASNSFLLFSQSRWRIPELLTITLSIQNQNGVQPLTEFHFIKVPAGSGQYAWIDFNGDGIKQIDEFQIAQFPSQAEYMRIALPSPRLIKVVDNQLQAVVQLHPSFAANSWIERQLLKFFDDFSLAIRQKKRNNKLFLMELSDTANVFANMQVLNRFGINVFQGMKFLITTQYQFNRDLLLGGFQQQKLWSNTFALNQRLTDRLNTQIQFKTGSKATQSQLFAQNNYHIRSRSLIWSVIYTNNPNSAQWQVFYVRKYAALQAQLDYWGTKFNVDWLTAKNLRINLSAQYRYNQLNGQIDNLLSYVLLEGFAVGHNLNVILAASMRLLPKLLLSISYNQRFTRDRKYYFLNFQVTGLF